MEGNSAHAELESGHTTAAPSFDAASQPDSRWGLSDRADEPAPQLHEEKGGGPALGPAPFPPFLNPIEGSYASTEKEGDEDSGEYGKGGRQGDDVGIASRRDETLERNEEEEEEEEEPACLPIKRQVSMLRECRSVEAYEKLNRISEGTYGVVYR
jgi:hypothetical protein